MFKSVTFLLLVYSVTFSTSLSSTKEHDDLYWEDEVTGSHEFLEVKPSNNEGVISGHIRRIRDALQDFYASYNNGDDDEEDQNQEQLPIDDEKDDIQDLIEPGSGHAILPTESTVKDLTMRVTFIINEPYIETLSSRDSLEFQKLANTLADAVNPLFDNIDGTQSASLVRIQSRANDRFSCKVTLDLTSKGNYDTATIEKILRNHIREKRHLGPLTASDMEWSFHTFNVLPTLSCEPNELSCRNGHCYKKEERCDDVKHCSDGTDEIDCPMTKSETETTTQPKQDNKLGDEDDTGSVTDMPIKYCDNGDIPYMCNDGINTFCPSERCDNYKQCPNGEDEVGCNDNNIVPQACSEDKISCQDGNGCYNMEQMCDGKNDCGDGSDESACPEKTDIKPEEPEQELPTIIGDNTDNEITTDDPTIKCSDDSEPILCNDGLTTYCPEDRCNTYNDCPDGEDEEGCLQECPDDHIVCDVNRCVPKSRVCDRVNDCIDRADENNCPPEACTAEDFRCDDNQCIDKSYRCNKVANCANGEDELNCPCTPSEFQCGSGECIEDRKRCDGYPHCSDRSDEENCIPDACKTDQWQCDYGTCISLTKRCNGKVDCPSDRSDERDCHRFRCEDGTIIPLELRCNRKYNCPMPDTSDEKNCPCGQGDFKCGNGFCIPFSRHCDGFNDCQDRSDEMDCPVGVHCTNREFKCRSSECIDNIKYCDRVIDCADGSDESHCPCASDEFHCTNSTCINISRRCDGHIDCLNGEDEKSCEVASNTCDGFRCDNGTCIDYSKRCNYEIDCPNGEDEAYEICSFGSDPDDCAHTCGDGTCIDKERICDGNDDCDDRSDERDCPCQDGDFRCDNGECIAGSLRCNGEYECTDNTDERGCDEGYGSDREGSDACEIGFWQCRNGECIENGRLCDSHYDCTEEEDESPELCTPVTSIPETTSYRYEYATPTYTTSRPAYTTPRPIYTTPNYYTTTSYWPYGNRRGEPELKTYPNEQTIKEHRYYVGGDVVFQCRDESRNGPRVQVKWFREGDRPIQRGAIEHNGRLEMFKVTPQDAGRYICRAIGVDRSFASSSAVVYLNIEPNNETDELASRLPVCSQYEATCSNGQCIPRNKVCDGKPDCEDRSDEDSCNSFCEPNQFRCRNRKCVSKNWVCDSENDCGDNSDEESCGPPAPGETCLPSQFTCASNKRCIPKSYQCDTQPECEDNSDEIGCLTPVVKESGPATLNIQRGETLTLTCVAVGVPVPEVLWRRNWGHVPDKCRLTSNGGRGVLVCPNMQPEDQGAYSCEALNTLGTVFWVPDTIVTVSSPITTCPAGYFNDQAYSPQDCISCFCFGVSNKCRSADLFSYQLQMLLGQGDTRLIGVRRLPNGVFNYNEPMNTFNLRATDYTVTINKISEGQPEVHPYVSLPETYSGNQLQSYGGFIRYKIQPHSRTYNYSNLPDIIIKGKYRTLIHHSRVLLHPNPRAPRNEYTIETRFFPGQWQKVINGRIQDASREDIMMALDDVEAIFIKAEFNGAGLNIVDFKMDSARPEDSGYGEAPFVEECQCPIGYSGLSCQNCAPGFERQQVGQWLGECKPIIKRCPPNTYGQYCQPCPCPLTNRENQFSTGCYLDTDSLPTCDCFPGYEGRRCEICSSGYEGNPSNYGDKCRPARRSRCDEIGTANERNGTCICKQNVQGVYCSECKDNSIFLSPDNVHGCARCFCSGVTDQCTTSNLRRQTTFIRFGFNTQSDVKLYTVSSVESKFSKPEPTDLQARPSNGELVFDEFDRTRPHTYYWSLPKSFAGDKVTAYGGYLKYTIKHIPIPGGQMSKNNAADVMIKSSNHITISYYGNASPNYNGLLNGSVQLMEQYWKRTDGLELTRELLLLALADVEAIFIKATYTTNSQEAAIISASIETADENGNGPTAVHVEQCKCPTGYMGTSCEDCAPGFSRSTEGIYLEHCSPCDCNNKADGCDSETGVCYNCRDNAAGEHCEYCMSGYVKDEYDNCVPGIGGERPYPQGNGAERPYPQVGDCVQCDPRGSEGCIDDRCTCKRNVQGDFCNECKPGTFGLNYTNPYGCLECYCAGVTNNCQEAYGWEWLPFPAPILSENHGFTLTTLDRERVINDDLIINIRVNEISFIYRADVPKDPLYWSVPLSGNRITSYGGLLSFKQEYKTQSSYQNNNYYTDTIDVVLVGETESVYWSYPFELNANDYYNFTIKLTEDNWRNRDSGSVVYRSQFLSILSDLQQVLIKATLSSDITSTRISDVSMDVALKSQYGGGNSVFEVEICSCPEGYSGTSCEQCDRHYYKDIDNTCKPCQCNGRADGCHLDHEQNVVCDCTQPFTGVNCDRVENGQSPNIIPSRPNLANTIQIDVSPKLEIAHIGGSVTYHCKAHSTINPRSRLKLKWDKSGGYLPRERSNIDYYEGTLTIRDVKVSDSGVYICTASDGVSVYTNSVKLQVPSNDERAPRITDASPNVYQIYEGQPISLTCIAEGNPAPQISWMSERTRSLPYDARIVDGNLIFDAAKQTDSGDYKCIASNSIGSIDRIVNVVVLPTKNDNEELIIWPNVAKFREGERTRIECRSKLGTIPDRDIVWERYDNQPLASNTAERDGILEFYETTPEHSGVYVCKTQSPIQTVSPSTILVEVVPDSPSQPSYDVVIKADNAPTNYITLPQGDSKHIECAITGFPQPLIVWRKEEGEFGRDVSVHDNVLMIYNAQVEDTGTYVCEASDNGIPVAENRLVIVIESREKPTVSIWPENEQVVPIDSEFVLYCRASGIPVPSVSWSKGKGSSALPSHVHIEDDNRILRFQTIVESDEDTYTCTATNVGGTTSASIDIKVQTPPKFSFVPSNYVRGQIGQPLVVECRAQGRPTPAVYLVNLQSGANVTEPSIGSTVYQIPYLSDEHLGEYECIGIMRNNNETYRDRLSIWTDGAVPENGPSEIAEGHDAIVNCEVTSGGSSLLTVHWRRADNVPSRHYQDGTKLIIRNATEGDSGLYECIVLDERTHKPSVAFSVNINVIRVPIVTIKPQIQNAAVGESPSIECIVRGDEPITVQWLNEAGDLPSNGRTDGRTLKFNRIQVNDAGIYVCHASNQYGRGTGTVEIKVSAKRQQGFTKTALVGTNAQLKCQLNPGFGKITWTRARKALPPNAVLSKSGILTIKKIQKINEGVYICVGYDHNGQTMKNRIVLKVNAGSAAVRALTIVHNKRTMPTEAPMSAHLFTDSRGNVRPRDNSRPSRYDRVYIKKPSGPFNQGDTVQVECITNTQERPMWIRTDGKPMQANIEEQGQTSTLYIPSVVSSDVGPYRCYIVDSRGAEISEEFQLQIKDQVCEHQCSDGKCLSRTQLCDKNTDCDDGSDETNCQCSPNDFVCDNGKCLQPHLRCDNNADCSDGSDEELCDKMSDLRAYVAPKHRTIDMSCQSDLSPPVTYEWKKEDGRLPYYVDSTQNILTLVNVSEQDAGKYICLTRNNFDKAKTQALLKVTEVVPQFTGDSWIELAPLKDSYSRFNIKMTFKPEDENGLILSSVSRPNQMIDLQMVNSYPKFSYNFGSDVKEIRSNIPLELGTWNTIQVTRNHNQVVLLVNDKRFTEKESGVFLSENPVYIGGTRENTVSGFVGCISSLEINRDVVDLMDPRFEKYHIGECNSCEPNPCLNDGVCQPASNKDGFFCLCPPQYGGLTCNKAGNSCKPGYCGPGRCEDTDTGYICKCPVTHTGKYCENEQNIQYPAFTGDGYMAFAPPTTTDILSMTMDIKAMSDGIILYYAENDQGTGGFLSLSLHNGFLELRFDPNGNNLVELVNPFKLDKNIWANVKLMRVTNSIRLTVDKLHTVGKKLPSNIVITNWDSSIYIGGVDTLEQKLNPNVGMTHGFVGCVKNIVLNPSVVLNHKTAISSSTVVDCTDLEKKATRGDILVPPKMACMDCRNGGYCEDERGECICPPNFQGIHCEIPKVHETSCERFQCENNATCRMTAAGRKCECPFGYYGNNCEKDIKIDTNIKLKGDGYVVLRSGLLPYDDDEEIRVAFSISAANGNGLLFYQQNTFTTPESGDFIKLELVNGYPELKINFGSETETLRSNIRVDNKETHSIIFTIDDHAATLTVDLDTPIVNESNGLASQMNIDSDIYIGGVPDDFLVENPPAFYGCIHQLELSNEEAVNFATEYIDGRNVLSCPGN